MTIYAFISALIWLTVTLISHGFWGTRGFFYDLPNGQMPFGRFFILYVLAFILYLIAVIRASKLQAGKRYMFIVIAAAIVFRLLLLPGIPVHENDIYRYIWDGKVSTAGINPYKYPPLRASIKPFSTGLRNPSTQNSNLSPNLSFSGSIQSSHKAAPGHTGESGIPSSSFPGLTGESGIPSPSFPGLTGESSIPSPSFPGLTGESSSFKENKNLRAQSFKPGIKPASTELSTDFEKLKSIRDQNSKFYRRISFKDIPTVYPPFAQAVFVVSTLIAPGSILLMKLLFVLFDTAVIFLLYLILKSLKQNPLYVVVYAWNPLVLKEFANSGHYDSLAIFCVMAAVYLVLKKKYLFSSVGLGLGVLSKFYPIIFIPFFLLKKQYKAFFTCFIVIAVGYVPFFFWGNTGPGSVFAGFGAYTQEWANNGFLFSLINSSVSIFSNNPYIFSKIICGIIFLIIWMKIYFNRQDLIEKMFYAVTAIFLLSPVGDPWYFCWVIPFLCIYRRFSLIVLSGLLILHYFVFTRDFGEFNLGSFKIDNLLLMQYVPFYVLLLFEWHHRRHLLI